LAQEIPNSSREKSWIRRRRNCTLADKGNGTVRDIDPFPLGADGSLGNGDTSEAVPEGLRGKIFYSPFDHVARMAPKPLGHYASLSLREQQVTAFVAGGLLNKQAVTNSASAKLL
jgi:hypothetical protein